MTAIQTIATWREAEMLLAVDDYRGAFKLVSGIDPSSPYEFLIAGIAESSQASDQERARDFLTRAVEGFALEGNETQADRAKGQLALSYWRAGEMQEALAYSEASLSGSLTGKLKAWASVDRAVILDGNGQTKGALEVLNNAEGLVPLLGLTLRGKFYNQRAIILRKLAKGKRDLLVDAISDYERAGLCFQESGNLSLQATVRSNLAGIQLDSGEFNSAHQNVDRAIEIFTQLNDRRLAKSLDQRAQIEIAQGVYKSAIESASQAVAVIGDIQPDWLAEALITLGQALARDGQYEAAQREITRACGICEHLGDKERAGAAYATLLEETPLNYREALRAFLRADELCSDRKRVLSLGAKVAKLIEPSFIKLALEDAGGKVTTAAKSLGMYHSLLITKIKKYDLEDRRKTPRVRRWKRKPVLSSRKKS